ncbi:hypothetical protein NT2_05_00790 [Caenibius tardaugens NBRC 16725]|uniref:DUF4136 domain-containing protein n=1 Tax=Caenibius tardaugens NBRC 16725 TaxID=1219035 RepID=U3A327_9SPHN|nr:DUF4136 domain-containing protein [Caenibius tardaugens]AZI36518.1 hypothetical protein EGO55_11605 [Caenibius tardaugens NBRC 16725]GAD49158.1 hypothetical protein NT2_05_00790 [Caenibius tardaugens NBRC 16725]
MPHHRPRTRRVLLRARAYLLAPVMFVALAGPALAQYGPGTFGTIGPVWHGGRVPARDLPVNRADKNDDTGKVEAAHFVAPDLPPGTLGHGPVTVTTIQGALDDPLASAPYEAAIVDQLVHAGYETAVPGDQGGQVVELRLIRQEARAKDPPRKPVSGAMAVGVSNHGTSTAMAVNVDLRKPKGALLSTRLEARIRDRANNTVLWEGRAEMFSRQGDSRWDQAAIAQKLAQALFDGFPNRNDGA